MDILGILSTIKGKVLDAGSFEFLQNAYEMQTKNIEQLQGNNEAIKESNDLLKEKNEILKQENADLKKRIAILEAKFKENKSSIDSQELSEVAQGILCQCIKIDRIEFSSEAMIRLISENSRIEIESGLDELEGHNFISQVYAVLGEGTEYSLTPRGKKLALQLSKNQKVG